MNIHICYANNKYYESQKKCSDSAVNIGGFDKSIKYNINDLDSNFKQKNSYILMQQRGAGYWLWKPYLILKTLMNISENDTLVYTDSGMYFVKETISYLSKFNNDVVSFTTCGLNKQLCKRDAFILMNLDTIEYTNSPQRIASILLFKKTNNSLNFVSEWLKFCEDPRIITDMPNTKQKNYPEFVDHRHDQSVFSLLAQKYNTHLSLFDLTQFANKDPYILHHRDSN
jgi:hypothetical protein